MPIIVELLQMVLTTQDDKMESRKVMFFLAGGFLLSFLGCIFLGYLWIDRSISLSYLKDSFNSTLGVSKRLESLLTHDWQGLEQEDVIRKLESESKRYPESNLVLKKYDNEKDVIWFGDIPFYFENDKLKKIGSNQ